MNLHVPIEHSLLRQFSKWAARQITNSPPDVVYCFSGIALELFDSIDPAINKLLARGSSHIQFQHDILVDAYTRHFGTVPPPGPDTYPDQWMIDREKAEYQQADAVIVQSTFAIDSFRRLHQENVHLMISAADTSHFSKTDEQLKERRQRIAAADALRVLTVGEFSLRKGAFELERIAAELASEGFEFRFVGSIAAPCESLARNSMSIEFQGRVPHFELVDHYAWADVFLFPTLEDGFAAVVAQAHSMGLPIISTRNCGAPDLMQCPQDGTLVDAGDTSAVINQLRHWQRHRDELAEVVDQASDRRESRDWADTAKSLVQIIESLEQQ